MIAIQLYTFRDQLRDVSQLSRVLGAVRDIGYTAVEVAGLGPKARQRLAAELRRADLAACAAHISLEQLLADLDGVAGACSDWGCCYAVVPTLPEEYRSHEGYLRFGVEARDLVERMRLFGLQLVYHNHSDELERFGRQTGLEILITETSPDILSAKLDTYWLQYAGANPAAWIRRLRGRVPLVHFKDMVVIDGHPAQAEVGEGNLDWVEILSACRDAGTQWRVVEQDESRDAVESAAISYANLTSLACEVRLEC